MTAPIQVRFKASSAQVEMITDPTMVKVWICGRQWGKTTAMKLALARMAITRPGSYSWFVSNNYAKSLEEMRKMAKSAGFMRFVRRPHTQFPPRFEMKNGSEIAFRSADGSDNLRGAGLHLIVQDEAAFAPEKVYRDVLLPMISATGGQYIIGSTYNGKNWLYKEAQDGISSGDPDIKTWVFPTSSGIMFQGVEGEARLARLRKRYTSAAWAQEFECEPLVIQNAAFRFIESALVDYPPPSMPDRSKKYIAGIDIGRRVDNAAIVVIECDTGLVVYVEKFELMIEHTVIAQSMKAICEYWHAAPCIDATQPGNQERWVDIYKDILPNCHSVAQNPAVKYNMISQLGHDIELKRLKIPKAWVELIDQMYDFQYRIPEGKQYPIYFPGTKHDDILSALYIGNWARFKGWEPDSRVQQGAIPAAGTQGRMLYDQRHRAKKSKGKL